MERALPAVRDFESLRAVVEEAGVYDGKKPDQTAARKLDAIEWQSAPTLLFVGRLISAKGIQSLLAALPLALAQVPDLRTIIVGHGPLRELMEAMVWALRQGRRDIVELIVARGRELDASSEEADADSRLVDVDWYYARLGERGELDDYFDAARKYVQPESIRFTGYLTHAELKHLFPCCDVGVFPSVVREAGPLVFLEALASGCFPLGTYFGGMAASIDALAPRLPANVVEIMKLDPTNTVEELARKIPAAVREGGAVRGTLASVAREEYDWSSVSEKFLRVLRESEGRA